MTNCDLSVIVTCFNRSELISETIDSILASTFKNFELIVCDDASTDSTVEIVRSYSQIDSRIKLFINKENLGDYANRNKAVSYATCSYIKFVDSDDIIYPWTLEQMMYNMKLFPESGWGISIDSVFPDKPFPFVLTPREAYQSYYNTGELFRYSPLRTIMKRDLFFLLKGFPEKRMVGDFEMWHKFAKHTNVVVMQGGLTWYRKHAQQEYSDSEDFSVQYEEIRLSYLNADDCPLQKNEVKKICNKRRGILFRFLFLELLKVDIRQILVRWRLLKLYL